MLKSNADDSGDSDGAGGDTVADADDDAEDVGVEAEGAKFASTVLPGVIHCLVACGHHSRKTEAAVTQMDGRSCGKAWPEAFDAVARLAATRLGGSCWLLGLRGSRVSGFIKQSQWSLVRHLKHPKPHLNSWMRKLPQDLDLVLGPP